MNHPVYFRKFKAILVRCGHELKFKRVSDGYTVETTFLEAQRCVAIHSQIDVVVLILDGRAVAKTTLRFHLLCCRESGFRET